MDKSHSREHQVKHITASFLTRMSYTLVIHPKYIMEQLGKYRTKDGNTLLAVAILGFAGVERFLSEGLPI